MENEHIQRQINFMIEQQARFDAQIAKITERQNQTTRDLDSLAEKVASLADALLRLTNIVGRHDDILDRHDKQMAEHAKQMAEHAQQMAEWRERGKETDARLNVLMNVVERHISDKHGH